MSEKITGERLAELKQEAADNGKFSYMLIRTAEVKKLIYTVEELTQVNSDSFAYPTIEEYEELVGFKVNEAFQTGWLMARMMNSHFCTQQPDNHQPRN